MKTTNHFLRSSLFLKVLLTMLILSFSFTEQIKAQEDNNPLADKIQEMIGKMKDIRIKFQSIASKGQGIPHWEKFENSVNRLAETIVDVETRVDNLVDKMSNLKLPFPDKLTIPGRSVLILGKWVTFPTVNIPVPGNNLQFPKISDFFANFLEPGNKALDKVLGLVTEIDDSMSTKSFSYLIENPSSDTTGWVYAEYHRAWQRWIKGLKITNQVLQGWGEAIKDTEDQNITLGVGGNISLAKVPIDLIQMVLNTFIECIDGTGVDDTGAEVTASYYRLDYIHNQIDTLKNDFKSYWQTTEIQRKIEENLALNSQGGYAIASFQRPPYIEDVKDIVRIVIEDMELFGENVYQAREFWNEGNNQLNAGDGHYKAAYYWYSKAYSEVTFVEIDK